MAALEEVSGEEIQGLVVGNRTTADVEAFEAPGTEALVEFASSPEINKPSAIVTPRIQPVPLIQQMPAKQVIRP